MSTTRFDKSSYTDHNKYLANRRKERAKVKERNRQYLSEHLDPCLFCGSKDNIHLHHYNPAAGKKQKNYLDGCSIIALQREMDKCWCLCNECHIKLHRRMVDPLPNCY